MKILLIYDELGKRDDGYILVQGLAREALEAGRIKPNTYLDRVFLPAMAQLYRANKPFIEPHYMEPNPLPQANYYQ